MAAVAVQLCTARMMTTIYRHTDYIVDDGLFSACRPPLACACAQHPTAVRVMLRVEDATQVASVCIERR